MIAVVSDYGSVVAVKKMKRIQGFSPFARMGVQKRVLLSFLLT